MMTVNEWKMFGFLCFIAFMIGAILYYFIAEVVRSVKTERRQKKKLISIEKVEPKFVISKDINSEYLGKWKAYTRELRRITKG